MILNQKKNLRGEKRDQKGKSKARAGNGLGRKQVIPLNRTGKKLIQKANSSTVRVLINY